MTAVVLQTTASIAVLRLLETDAQTLSALLGRFGLQIHVVEPGESIAGSHWGESEAGLIENRLYVRPDTPLHSIFHEAAHYICMDDARRAALHTDAGGTDQEENAVCYLQILLADEVRDFGRTRMMQDMDAWGYTFRLSSARAWFEQDAEDARAWLLQHGVIDTQDNGQSRTTGRLRI
jgi:hypothetical protein